MNFNSQYVKARNGAPVWACVVNSFPGCLCVYDRGVSWIIGLVKNEHLGCSDSAGKGPFCQADYLVWTPEPAQWNERANPCKLYSDFHMSTRPLWINKCSSTRRVAFGAGEVYGLGSKMLAARVPGPEFRV